MTLHSPRTGAPLSADSPHSLAGANGERWPLVDGIAYLRINRDPLVADVLRCLDGGDRVGALTLLLSDQDDWWNGGPADAAQVRRLVENAASLSFREAMTLLGFGRVGDYFAHRWSDPTYLAGLALMAAHWPNPSSAFELACGAGHYLRELSRRGVACTGVDVVFAKLWLAKHWVLPGSDVELVCFDAAAPWPLRDRRYDLVLCHDAFYFLEPKRAILDSLRSFARSGLLAMAHIHNRAWPNMSAGSSINVADLAALCPDAVAYDDAELTRALAQRRAPSPSRWSELQAVEAFALVEGEPRDPAVLSGGLALPPADARLARNPLYGAGNAVVWPSKRYQDEYERRATYPLHASAPDGAAGPQFEAMARSRELVDLPERW